ncbi:MAG: ribosome maturation factor RimM [Candidatus Eisenbacteria bacterium]|nr:ribosome maturation factor RimM [Candidatus Eisenbacteria bacterium]
MEAQYISIGRIAKSFGVNGEVVVDSLSDSETRFESLKDVYLLAHGTRTKLSVENVRPFGKRFIVRFRDIADRDRAEKLPGSYIQIEKKDVAPLPDGRHYIFELIGLDVLTEDGVNLGKVQGIIPTGENDVYEVHGPGGEILIPATKEVVKHIDIPGAKIVVKLIPGLLD